MKEKKQRRLTTLFKLPDSKAGILLDGHHSHENPKTLAALKENVKNSE
jgi:hypothetical protein